MRIPGKSLMTRDHTRSAAAEQMFIGCSVIMTSTGASGLVTVRDPDDPRWMDSTTPSSHNAVHSGSHAGSWKLGNPRFAGLSVKVNEWQPLAATRRTSAAASSGSHSTGRAMGMKRPGWAPHHDSMCQSL